MGGGVALPKEYFDRMGKLAHSDKMNNVNVHVDGARIFNAAVAQDIEVKDLCENVDSVSICLSKGLGAPLGSVLVGEGEFIEVAKRARKRCGGGMRQVGVVASMGLFAVKDNIERLAEDHTRAKKVREDRTNERSNVYLLFRCLRKKVFHRFRDSCLMFITLLIFSIDWVCAEGKWILLAKRWKN
jgi:threonine aldolase